MFLNHILHKLLHIDEKMMKVAGVRLTNARLLDMILERYFFKKKIVTFFMDLQNKVLAYYAIRMKRIEGARNAMQLEAYKERKQFIQDNLDDIVQEWEDVAREPNMDDALELPEVMRDISVDLVDMPDEEGDPDSSFKDVKIIVKKHPIMNLFHTNGMLVDL
jgi:hypothetical protein